MRYVFRWQCRVPPATLVIELEAFDDASAGLLAADLLQDFVKGRSRTLRWEPMLPVISTA